MYSHYLTEARADLVSHWDTPSNTLQISANSVSQWEFLLAGRLHHQFLDEETRQDRWWLQATSLCLHGTVKWYEDTGVDEDFCFNRAGKCWQPDLSSCGHVRTLHSALPSCQQKKKRLFKGAETLKTCYCGSWKSEVRNLQWRRSWL